ncbi:MAG: DUF5309 family protein [Nitrospiraceae bacterium]
MAAISGTLTTLTSKGQRESLGDRISRIDPEETLFLSMIGKGPRAKAITEEWLTDSLRSPDTSNARLEGNVATYTTPAPRTRLGNVCQISDTTVSVSRTQEVIDKAGVKSDLSYQIAKEGVNLRRDQEAIVLTNQAADAGGSATPRKLASMLAWVKTNVDYHTTTGANPSYTSGVPTGTRTDGTQRAFTETIHKNVMALGWANGAKWKVLMVGPVNKQKVSATFTGIATRTIDLANASAKPMAAVAAIDVYVGDFYTLRVVPNRLQRERDAWYLDPEFAEIRDLTPITPEKMAKTGDSEQRLLVTEYTLVVRNEKAFGLAADLTTTL